jgi:Uncharacterized protein conserved in bacteria
MRPITRLAAAVLLWGLAAGSGLADPTYDSCVNAASSNADWSRCGGEFVQREDDKLNTVWKRVYALTDGQSKTDLLAEQRAWVAFKDKACQLYANGDYGREGQVLSYPSCLADVIADRTRQLEAIGRQITPR